LLADTEPLEDRELAHGLSGNRVERTVQESTGMEVKIETGGPVQICANCGSSNVTRANVRTALWHDGRLVVVTGVPALVCEACGEQYFDDQTVVQLDLLRGRGFPSSEAEAEIVVPVFSLRAATESAE
jgi:YgiT-type zinc finger domain-containing protein